VLALDHHNHVEHVGGEAETVTELLDGHCGIDQDEVFRLGVGQVNEHQVGTVHDDDHRPQPETQALLRNEVSAGQPADHQASDPHSPVNPPNLAGGQSQAADFSRIEQEGRDHLDQLGLSKAVEQQERNKDAEVLLLEEKSEGVEEFSQDALAPGRDRRAVAGWIRQDELVIHVKNDIHTRQDKEDTAPGKGNVPGGRTEDGFHPGRDLGVELEHDAGRLVPVPLVEDQAATLQDLDVRVSRCPADHHNDVSARLRGRGKAYFDDAHVARSSDLAGPRITEMLAQKRLQRAGHAAPGCRHVALPPGSLLGRRRRRGGGLIGMAVADIGGTHLVDDGLDLFPVARGGADFDHCRLGDDGQGRAGCRRRQRGLDCNRGTGRP